MTKSAYSWESTQLDPPAVVKFIETIEHCLATGALRPRESLVVKDLADRFGEKPSVVRQAIDALARHGFVAKRRNNTAVIRDFSVDELQHYYDVWKMLVHEGMSRVPLPADRQLLQALTRLEQKHEQAINRRERTEVYRCNLQFHRMIFESCGNRVLLDMYMHVLWILQFFKAYRLYSPARLNRAVEQHKRLIDALALGDRHMLIEISAAHQLAPEQWHEEVNLSETEALFAQSRAAGEAIGQSAEQSRR